MVCINRYRLTLLSAALLFSTLTLTSDVPDSSLPVQELLKSADQLLAAGDKRGALDHFDAALKKDPANYLTLFKRGATYLSLGRSSQASADFDSVLDLKPDFEAALLQRARLKAKAGNWDAARGDYRRAGSKHEANLADIDEAEKAAGEAKQAEKRGDWDTCVEKSGVAIVVAGGALELRNLRARCRMQNGDVHEAVSDLAQIAQLDPASIDPHLQIANLLYFSLADFDRATAQMRKCLHSDPDSKPCSKLFRRIKNYEKSVNKARGLREKRQWNSANKILAGAGEDVGVIAEVKEDVDELKQKGIMNNKSPETLVSTLNEMVCDGYTEMNKPEKARPFCEETLRLNPSSLPATLSKATQLVKEELFEEAIRLLDSFQENYEEIASSDRRFAKKLNEARVLLKRSKEKDYYKVLGVDREADERTIKRAYRKLVKQYHPDKYRGDLTPDQVQAKMSSINEAWEVLSTPELRERFDNGDDPNSQERQNPFAQGGHPFHGGFGGGQQQFMFRQGGGGGGGFPFGQQGGGFKFQF